MPRCGRDWNSVLILERKKNQRLHRVNFPPLKENV